MKCKVWKNPIQVHMTYGILKNFESHREITIDYMEFKEILRQNIRDRIIRDVFSSDCLRGRYLMK